MPKITVSAVHKLKNAVQKQGCGLLFFFFFWKRGKHDKTKNFAIFGLRKQAEKYTPRATNVRGGGTKGGFARQLVVL